ncbi:VanZ family protein [Streptomyces sp. HUAS MG91]|uniref:VanZ family protein n=1 Tax=Streptomyces tabacisoli TaxID=3156398 RepID=A0AAU8IRA9_9ACTN
MFSAIFRHHVGYLTVCVLLGLVLGATAWALATKRGKPHGPWWFALAFTLTGVLGVTFMGGGAASRACVLNHQFGEPFHTTQGMWNLAMTVPVGAFAVLAVRRPLPVLLGVVALPLGIEFIQATVDGLGRVCDSSDAEMNILGGLLGFTVSAVFLTGRRTLAWQAGAKGTLISSAVLLLLVSGVARPMLSFTNVDGTSLVDADADQVKAAEAAVTEAFGDRYTVGELYEQPCGDSACTNIIFNLHSREPGHTKDFAYGSLSWPDKKHLTVHLEDSARPTVMGYPVADAAAPSSGKSAHQIATSFAEEKYPWASGATTNETSQVGEKAELGWMTNWRWTHDDILMPRMLDVQIDRAGHVSQLDVTLGPTRTRMPKSKVRGAEAKKAVVKAVEARLEANQNTGAEFRAEAVARQAIDQDGKWEPNWLVNVTWPQSEKSDDPPPVDVYHVNALTGRVYDSDGKLLPGT